MDASMRTKTKHAQKHTRQCATPLNDIQSLGAKPLDDLYYQYNTFTV